MGHAVGGEVHLGMSALLAGVASKGIRQGDYLLERVYSTTTRRVATHWAANPILAA
jgi:hypothetical protein